MLKSFTYRLYPTKRQQRLLSEQLEEVRWLWNTLLAERKQAWEEQQETVDYYDQKAELPALKADVRPGLPQVHSQVVQEVALRLKQALDAFFRRLRAGETPGSPRFRGQGRYDALTYPQWDNGVKLSASGKRLRQTPAANACGKRLRQTPAAGESGRGETRLASPTRREAQDGDHPPHGEGELVRDPLLRLGLCALASSWSGGRHRGGAGDLRYPL